MNSWWVMTESRYDTARRCPTCGEPGELTKKEPAERGSFVYCFTCRNERCQDVKMGWLIQVMGNNEIPLRKERDDGR